MDLQLTPSRGTVGKCCDCGCSSSFCSPETWLRSVKRKYDELEGRRILSVSGLGQDLVVRVDTENEILALREMVGNQQKAIQDLISDLEEERNASSSSANEAMSMILRLQREKAEAQMEARQFKCMAEERIGHDQLEISAMEDLLYKREQVIQGLTCEVHAYKHRMMSYGLIEFEEDGENTCERSNDGVFGIEYDLQGYEYPPLKCKTNDNPGPANEYDNVVIDIDKYPFGETPGDQFTNLDYRIPQVERTSSFSQLSCDSPTMQNIPDKIIMGQSPQRPKHCRRLSRDSLDSSAGKGRDPSYDLPTESPRLDNSFKMPSKLKIADDASEEDNDVSDRIYTVETVYVGVQPSGGVLGTIEDYATTPRESFAQPDIVDPDIKKLYARLQALEADRESMCRAIISMQTDKAQLLLLKEIAQRLCKDPPPERYLPPNKPLPSRRFSVLSVFKWMGSILWSRRSRQCKYNLGLSPQHVGLLMLLQKVTPPKELSRCLTKVQARS